MSSSPPAYSPTQQHIQAPPYRASHGFANRSEELAALRQFAESKKWINPGTDGTLPDIAAGVKSVGVASGEMGDLAKYERRQFREMDEARKGEKLRLAEREWNGNVKGKEGWSEKLKRLLVTREKEVDVVR